MEIWLDTVDLDTISSANRFGVFYGVTTNPSLISQAKIPLSKIIMKLLETQEGPITVQVNSTKAAEIIEEAEEFQSRSDRIIIKIPATQEGLIAIRHLSLKEVPTMATAVFHPNQFLLAALAGATYIAPYLSRMSDAGIDPFTILEGMVRMYKNYDFKTKILAAALKNSDQIRRCSEIGIPAITIKDDLFNQFIADHPLTTQAVENFKLDWEKTKDNNPLYFA